MRTNWKRLALYICSYFAGCAAVSVDKTTFGVWGSSALVIVIIVLSRYLFDRLLNRWWVER